MTAGAIPYESELPALPRRSSLWPREHGVYVQLLAPLTAAMFVRSPTIAGVLLAITACAALLGTEAVLIARGARGARRQRVDGARAVHRARACSAIAAGAGTAGLILAPRSAIELVGLVALPAALALVLAARRKIHSFIGEQIAVIALAGASVPVVAASGMGRTDALVWWLVWCLGFAATVGAVRGVIGRHRKRAMTPAVGRRTDGHLMAFLLACLLSILEPRVAIALPLVFASAVIPMLAPSAKRMVAVGVALAIASALSGLIAVALG